MVTDVRHGTEDKLTPAGLVGKVGLGWVGLGVAIIRLSCLRIYLLLLDFGLQNYSNQNN